MRDPARDERISEETKHVGRKGRAHLERDPSSTRTTEAWSAAMLRTEE